MTLVKNLKQFLFASLMFSTVLSIHLNFAQSEKQSLQASKGTHQMKVIELSGEKLALNTIKQ
jgi:hypothetical protein